MDITETLSEDELRSLEASYEESCKKAAEAILGADILLLATGAGFSADSGLAVYKDIADIEPYHKRKKTYADLCQPYWIKAEPALFYGFWGACFNDYRKINPHKGYAVVKKWKESIFDKSSMRDVIVKEMKERDYSKKDEPVKSLEDTMNSLKLTETPYAGAFFVYTSNVDNHSLKAGFAPEEIFEIHGTSEDWQCAVPCKEVTWKAPRHFEFDIDRSTMLATTKEIDKLLDGSPTPTGWKSSHPTCIHCSSPARPAVLMFGDNKWIHDRQQSKAYTRWKGIVHTLLKENPQKKIVLLEIGCGLRVPSVRYQTEDYIRKVGKDQCTLIRINPDYPMYRGEHPATVISIKAKGLTALETIDTYIDTLQKPEAAKL